MFAYAEVEMNSVERLVELTKLEAEAPDTIDIVPPPAYWPSTLGSIEIENLSVRYAPDLPLVLKQIKLSFRTSYQALAS